MSRCLVIHLALALASARRGAAALTPQSLFGNPLLSLSTPRSGHQPHVRLCSLDGRGRRTLGTKAESGEDQILCPGAVVTRLLAAVHVGSETTFASGQAGPGRFRVAVFSRSFPSLLPPSLPVCFSSSFSTPTPSLLACPLLSENRNKPKRERAVVDDHDFLTCPLPVAAQNQDQPPACQGPHEPQQGAWQEALAFRAPV